jgi:hypothetical protein
MEITLNKGEQNTWQMSAFLQTTDANNRISQTAFELYDNDYVLADFCIQNSADPTDKLLKENIAITEADGYQFLVTVTKAESLNFQAGNDYQGQVNIKKAGGLEPVRLLEFKVIVKPTII